MKLFNIMILALTGLTPLATPALADQKAISDEQAQVGAELSLTKDAIGQLLARMQDSSTAAGTLDEADYLAKMPAYQARIAAATARFQDALENPHNGILVQLQAMMSRYNAIFDSRQYSDETRTSMLMAQKQILFAYAAKLSVRYAAELLKLFDAPGFVIERMGSAMTQNIAWLYTTEYIYSFLSQACYSSSCITQSAMDEANYLSLVNTMFNRTLTFHLKDGFALSLQPIMTIMRTEQYASEWDTVRSSFGFDPLPTNPITSISLGECLNWVVKSVSRIENYPPAYDTLPASIDEATLKIVTQPPKPQKPIAVVPRPRRGD